MTDSQQTPTEEYNTEALALAIAEAAWDLKALNVRVKDVRGLVPYADYLVIAHGTSDRHSKAIAENAIEDLRPLKIRPRGIEGLRQSTPEDRGRWVLVDFDDVVLHVFSNAELRSEYNIERLFGDAPNLTLDAPEDLEVPEPSSDEA